MKIQKKKNFFFGGWGVGGRGRGRVGGQDGCDRRNEVFVKIQKKNILGGGGRGGVGSGGRVGGGSGWGGVALGGGVRVDVNEELKFLGKFTKEKIRGGGGGRFGGGFFFFFFFFGGGGSGGRLGGSGWM